MKTAASKDTEPPVGVLVAAVVGGGAFLVLILLVIYCMGKYYNHVLCPVYTQHYVTVPGSIFHETPPLKMADQ